MLFKPPSQRGHVESPFFWIILLASSILVNTLFVLGFQTTLQRLKPLSLEFAPIAVDFVPTGGIGSTRGNQRQTPGPSRSAPKTTSAPTAAPKTGTTAPPRQPAPKVDNQGAIAVPPTNTTQRPPVAPEPMDDADDPPKTKRSQPTPPASPTPPRSTEQPEPPAAPQSPSSTTNQSANTPGADGATTTPMPPGEPSPPGPATSGVLLPGVPAVPDPDRNRVPADPIRPTRPQVISQNPIPASFSATLTVAPAPEPEGVVAPVLQDEPTKVFQSQVSRCVLHPEALHSFGQSVVLQIEVDAAGQVVTPVQVANSSQNDRYDQLAQCVVQEWQFKPAMTTQASQKLPVAGQLTVQVAIAHTAD